MPRVASLYLPNLPIDRLRRIESARFARPEIQTKAEARPTIGWGGEEQSDPTQLPPGTRIGNCSCPRGDHWRPGARWAREELLARIEALPAHRRPSMREIGRSSESAGNPFRKELHVARSARVRSSNSTASPLVTAHRDVNRIVLAAVSPEAKALGLHPGMPLTQARILASALEVRDADHEGDADWLFRLGLFAARRWTPRAAVSDPAGLWLDLEGVAHLFGGEQRMCERILAFCRRLGFAARIAVAGTSGAAHALARHAEGAITLCPSGSEAQWIADFPLAALRMDDQTLGAARRLGVERVGELIVMPRAPLQRRFGLQILLRLDQVLGRAAEPFDPIIPKEPPSLTLRFLEPIATPEAIEEATREAISRFVPILEQAGLGVRRLDLLCERVDRDVQQIGIGTVRPTRQGPHLARLLCAKIEKIEPGFGIEAVRLVASRVEPLAPQPIDTEEEERDLAALIDCVAGRIGTRHVYRMSAVESDVPERCVRRVGPLSATACWPKWPRPVRLLARPEPVVHVVSLHPDGGPKRFTWRGKTHRIARWDGPERLYGEWWKRASEAEAVRDYFQVEDQEGNRFWLFRRGDPQMPPSGDKNWFMHGLFA